MRKQKANRLQLNRETLQPLTGQGAFGVDIKTPRNSAEDCTSPLCVETTCPRTCGGCDGTVIGVQELTLN